MLTNSHDTLLHTQTNTCKDLATLLIAYLKQLSIDYVFGIPGGAIEPLYNALAVSERCHGPRAIIARHESGAAFMAEGYARYTGKLGVCCATTGPGTTNLITGVCSAYASQIPLLVISAQTRLETFGKGALQESACTGINTLAMFESCTRYNTLVSHVAQFERKLATAIIYAHGPLPGPVHLSIPLDLMRSATPATTPSYQLTSLIKPSLLLDNHSLEVLFQELKSSKRTVFVIGDGAGEAIDTIVSLAELLNATILSTPHGKGFVDSAHPNYRGIFGFAGHKSATRTLEDPALELIVYIGATLGEWATNGWKRNLLLTHRMIHVARFQHNFAYSPMAKLHVQGNLKLIFDFLLKKFNHNQPLAKKTTNIFIDHGFTQNHPAFKKVIPRKFDLEDEDAYFDSTAPIRPQYLMQLLPKLFPPNTCYLADSGNSLTWAIHYLHPAGTGKHNANAGSFSASLDFASMGWAIGNAVGTALARPGDPVICITGDGSMLMSGQELTVAVQEKLPIVFVLLNDSSLGMVKHGQRLAGAERIGIDIPPTNFAAIATAMGAQGFAIDSPQDLLALDFPDICKRKGPTLLDVHIDKEAIPPMGIRMNVLQESL